MIGKFLQHSCGDIADLHGLRILWRFTQDDVADNMSDVLGKNVGHWK